MWAVLTADDVVLRFFGVFSIDFVWFVIINDIYTDLYHLGFLYTLCLFFMCWIFFVSVLAKRLAGTSISKPTYFVWSWT